MDKNSRMNASNALPRNKTDWLCSWVAAKNILACWEI
jgi:hypothetical protein